MAKSMYNSVLLNAVSDLKKFVAGELLEVDLSSFQALSTARAERKGKTARKNWSDSASIVGLENGKPQVVETINAHTMATGDVLGALGYRGSFFISNSLKLTRIKASGEERITYTTLEEIVAAANEPEEAVEAE